ncbi:MAG: CoA activase [Fidelibacterota bacterium]|nr:MAG: CoA activase [Candidatus Neomarinimicrobiota bacterium]
MSPIRLRIGLDVGSTTVKAVVVDARTDQLVWRAYQRHESGQADRVLAFLKQIAIDFPDVPNDQIDVCITGSGGKTLSDAIGARYVQEVSAICRTVEKYHPETGSVIELGGQDAKILIFREDPTSSLKRKFLSMNDKCAGGTGAVIDKISAKLGISLDQLAHLPYNNVKLHHVAGKCGVFAETDINSLRMQGAPKGQLVASLFQAFVEQNLAVLTRGYTIRPVVLLLGGPNTFLRGMQEAWRANLFNMWQEREVPLPENPDLEKLILVPEDSLYYAAIGAIEYTKGEELPIYPGWQELETYLQLRLKRDQATYATGLWKTPEELETFRQKYERKPFEPAVFAPGERVEAFIGLDGGSTSTKAVLMNSNYDILAKAYKLTEGNPIEDTKEIFAALRRQIEASGARLDILGLGVTGYAERILREILQTDAAIVETVAHTKAALHYYEHVDVICDVGGQDIKLMFLKDGKVKDFKLNTQCSAGNGYFLQGTAKDFGMPVEHYADVAFQAEAMPMFGYGCAIFLQSDIVNFQRQGWKSPEIMAGLAAVLPKNIWFYVAQIPNLERLGTNFVLQGGTQHNLAAVKAQVDFIRSRFRGEVKPNIIVHQHCGETGAIGAALEAIELWQAGRATSFIGLDATDRLQYNSTTSENTRCHFCKNKCLRTFIDVSLDGKMTASEQAAVEGDEDSKVPLPQGHRRLIVGNACEKGSVEDRSGMQEIKKTIDAQLEANPNFVDLSARRAYRSFSPRNVAESLPGHSLLPWDRKRVRLMKQRPQIRIGIPRLLNMYQAAPFFSAYFESLGIPYRNIVLSDSTTGDLYREGAKRGAIDPCYPAKLAIPHVHNLIHVKHERKPLDIIFFPMIDDIPSIMMNIGDSRLCPTITATPEGVKAAFIKEEDLFKKKGIRFLDTFLNMGHPELLEQQLYQQFRDILGLSKKENAAAVQAGYAALDNFDRQRRSKAKAVLQQLEKENRIGLVLLGRPYHNDPGINHDVMVELQKKGYPIFTPDSLPIDEEILERLFGDEVRAGVISHPMDISDVWKNAYSEMSTRKLWAAKYAARHPNLAALEISNFKCGHDAPIYMTVEEIVESSGTPYFGFKDLDENKPAGSIRIRVETIDYFLKQHREDMLRTTEKRKLVAEQIAKYEKELRQQMAPAG